MNNSKKQRVYTKEFKEEAIKLAMKSVSYAQVAKNLDIPLGTLYGWLEKVKKPSSPDFKTDNLISSKALLEENSGLALTAVVPKSDSHFFSPAEATI